MIRFLFPKISFSGRLDRLGFWREIMVSAITTPIAVGIVTYLAHEGARAAEQGFVVDNARVKAAVGFLLALYAIRHSLVFAGVVRRRLNDLGLQGVRVFKPAVPLLLFFGVSFIFTLVSLAPSGGEKHIAVGVLTFALVALIWWQAARAITLGFQVMFGRSNALAGGKAAPSMEEAMAGTMNKDMERIAAGLRVKFDSVIKGLDGGGKGKPEAFGAIDKLFAPAMEALNEWGRPASASAGEARVRDARDETRMHRQSTPARPAVDGSGAHKKAAVVARHEPRTGRSRWYDGLLAGPWG